MKARSWAINVVACFAMKMPALSSKTVAADGCVLQMIRMEIIAACSAPACVAGHALALWVALSRSTPWSWSSLQNSEKNGHELKKSRASVSRARARAP